MPPIPIFDEGEGGSGGGGGGKNFQESVRGCTDPNASNYNPRATINNGSCIYPAPSSDPDPDPIVSPSIATALPSLPSISNVGSTAPTGVVNWNAIPGGFQPLPQTVGQRKKLYQLSQFHGGVHQKSSPRDISDQECQEAINVTVSQVGRIKLLGTCGNEVYGTDISPTGIEANYTGYGLFVFSAPADQDGNVGELSLIHI